MTLIISTVNPMPPAIKWSLKLTGMLPGAIYRYINSTVTDVAKQNGHADDFCFIFWCTNLKLHTYLWPLSIGLLSSAFATPGNRMRDSVQSWRECAAKIM